MADRPSSDELVYRRIVRGTNVGIWVLDGDGRTTFANDRTSEILGYPIDEMEGVSLFDVVDENGKAHAAQNLALRRQGIEAQLECAFVRRDGSRVWVLVNTAPLRDDDGGYAGAVSRLSEITERKYLEEALQQREQQLAEAQRVAHLGSWEWDAASDRTAWSGEFFRLLGLDARQVEPTPDAFLARVHPEDVAMVRSWFARSGGTSSFGGDHRIVRPSGPGRPPDRPCSRPWRRPPTTRRASRRCSGRRWTRCAPTPAGRSAMRTCRPPTMPG